MAWFTSVLKAIKTIGAIVGAVTTAAKVLEKLEGVVAKWAPTVRDWWNGKKIAVLGPTAAGKNSLYNRLRGLPIPSEHKQTRGADPIQNFDFAFPLPNGTQFKITCKRAQNVGGERDERERYWLGACEGSDVVFYMITVDDLKTGSFRSGKRIHDDLTWLAAHLPRMAPQVRVHILVNKIDLVLAAGRTYDNISTEFKPVFDELEQVARGLFGAYQDRLTGITPTSMLNDHLFAISFGLALQAVHDTASR